jgi:hypothetical protein
MADIAGINMPPGFSTIFRDSFGKTRIHGMRITCLKKIFSLMVKIGKGLEEREKRLEAIPCMDTPNKKDEKPVQERVDNVGR